jgi:DNA-binding response OmpR family regulator
MSITMAREESGQLKERRQPDKPPDTYVYDDGDLIVRPSDYVALARGQLLDLPRRVLFLLFELARRPGVVRTRADLAVGAWGAQANRIKLQSVDQAISRLRHSLYESLPELDYVHTHTGLGYRFEREAR